MIIAEPKSSARLFFALWPDGTTRRQLQEAQERLHGLRCRWIPSQKLHLTLAFLGEVKVSRMADLAAAAVEAAGPPFTIRFDRLELWRRRQILCMTPSEPPDALFTLAGALYNALKDRRFDVDARPFRAHLTLARRVHVRALPTLDVAPAVWPANSFCLVESELDRSGARYRVVETWLLPGGVRRERP